MCQSYCLACLVTIAIAVSFCGNRGAGSDEPSAPTEKNDGQPTRGNMQEWAQWGGSPARNNARKGQQLPVTWSIGKFDGDHELARGTRQNIRWVAGLGSVTYGTPAIAGGKVFIGTNNSGGRLDRYPSEVDLGCLLCFRVADGEFLWQHSAEKLATGRQHDWPFQGLCSTPLVEENRLWFVTNRCEVVCLDTEGFRDDENDGPYRDEPNEHSDESDVVWRFDMYERLGVRPHNMSTCSITAAGNLIFVCTSNGVDESHAKIPAPDAPSFLAMDKRTGRVVWSDNSPGNNILHSQWSSPAFGVLNGVPQVIFAGGDGWLYSFRADEGHEGKPEVLWEFDCNPKEARFNPAGRSSRSQILAMPMIHDGLVYIGVGEDPEYGEGEGHLWCVDPTKRGDVSSERVFNVDNDERPVPHRRVQAAVVAEGDIVRANPNSASVWHYAGFDLDGDGKIRFEETMHRTASTAAVQDGLLVVPDLSGLIHCLDAKAGHVHWTHDLKVTVWCAPLIADGKVYVPDEEGNVNIFELSVQKKLIRVIEMDNSLYVSPVAAGGVLYLTSRNNLFAIATQP